MIVSKRSPKPRLKETQLRVAHCQCRAHPHHPPTNVPKLPLLKLDETLVESVQSAQENLSEKELEFYELLDLDMNIDNTTEQVLEFE